MKRLVPIPASSVEEPENRPAPPEGYATWLDYAVDCVDTRSVELESLFENGPAEGAPTREAIRLAVKAELDELRQRAGIRGQHRLSDLMTEMPEGLLRAERGEDAKTVGKPPDAVITNQKSAAGLIALAGSEPELDVPRRRHSDESSN